MRLAPTQAVKTVVGATVFLFLSFSFAYASVIAQQPTLDTVFSASSNGSGGGWVLYQGIGNTFHETIGSITMNLTRGAGVPEGRWTIQLRDFGTSGYGDYSGVEATYTPYLNSMVASSTIPLTVGDVTTSFMDWTCSGTGCVAASGSTGLPLQDGRYYALHISTPVGAYSYGITSYQFKSGGTSADTYSGGTCVWASVAPFSQCSGISDAYFIIYDINGNDVVATPLNPFNPFVWTPLGSSTLNSTFSNALTDIADINESNATTSATAGLQSFYNVPSYFANRVPFGYIYDIYNIWNNVSTSTTEFGSLSIDFDSLDIPTSTRSWLPGEVIFFSTSTVTSYVDDTLLDLLNALASAAIAVTFSLSLFRRATTVIKPV